MNYEHLSSSIDQAKVAVSNHDRRQYEPYFAAAEKYLEKIGGVIGGDAGIAMMQNAPHELNLVYILYLPRGFSSARELIEELDMVESEFDRETIFLETNMTGQEFTIYVNLRPLFKIYYLGKYRGISLKDLIGPTEVSGFFADAKLLAMSGEMYLIEIYQKLYTPYNNYSDKTYTELMDLEDRVFSETVKYLEKKALTKVGGSQQIKAEDVASVIMQKYVSGRENVVVIGDYAAEFYIDINEKRLQILDDSNCEELVKILEGEFGKKVVINKFDPMIFSDFRLQKRTLYMENNGGTRLPIADIFNSTAYELVPYHESKRVRYARHFPLLRFYFIDLWLLKLINNLPNARSVEGSIRATFGKAHALRVKMREMAPMELFGVDFAGANVAEVLAKKRLLKEQKIRHRKIFAESQSSSE